MGSSTRNPDKNLRKQAKMVKKKILEYVGREWKRQHEKK